MSGPLHRRHQLMAPDEDDAGEMTPSERARFVDAARRQSARHDRTIVEAGRQLLAEYMADGRTWREAFDAYISDLFGDRGGS